MGILHLLLVLGSIALAQGNEECSFNATRITTRLRTPRVSVQAVYDGDDTIYLVGGYGDGGAMQDILKFTISTEEITAIGQIPIPLEGFSVARDDIDRLYIMRGHQSSWRTTDIYRFTPDSGEYEASYVGSFAEEDSHSTVFQADEWSAYLLGGYWGKTVIKYDFLRNTTETLLEHPYCYKMHPVYDHATNSTIVFCDKGPANDGAFVWKYDVATNKVTTLLEDFPRFGDQVGSSWDGEDAFIYALFGTELPYGGLLQYNHPSGNLTFIPVGNFPGTSTSPLRSAATVHVPHLNRLYLFGGSRANQSPFFQDSIYHINLGCRKPPPTSPTPPTSTTTERPQPDLVDCSNKTDGFYPHPLGCEMFVGCRSGQASVYTCPDPYLFDPQISTCNQPHLVDCQLTCEDKDDGLHPHPYDCALVISCNRGSMDVFKCPPPLLFDPVNRICNFPDLVDCNV